MNNSPRNSTQDSHIAIFSDFSQVSSNNSHDLHAGLLSDASYTSQYSPNQSHIALPTGDEPNLYESVDFLRAHITFSIFKICASISVLILSNKEGDNGLANFVVYMIAYDCLNTAFIFIKLSVLLTAPHTRHLQEANPQEVRVRRSEMREYKKKQKTLKIASIVLDVFYCAIFIAGQIKYFKSNSENSKKTPLLHTISFVYIIFGYFGFVLPLAFKTMAWTVHAIIDCKDFIVRKRQNRVNKNLLKKMSKKYRNNGKFPCVECSICIQDFQEGDKVIPLKCSEKHIFHTSCLRRWLKVNSACPICRTKVEQ